MDDVYRLSASRLVQHVRSRREQHAGPATAKTDLIYIGVVLKVAQAVGSYPVDPTITADAAKACRRLHLIGESRWRDIRPNETQLVALTRYFLSRPRNVVIPMADIMWFAIYSARREGEICRLRWAGRQQLANPYRTSARFETPHTQNRSSSPIPLYAGGLAYRHATTPCRRVHLSLQGREPQRGIS